MGVWQLPICSFVIMFGLGVLYGWFLRRWLGLHGTSPCIVLGLVTLGAEVCSRYEVGVGYFSLV